MKIIIGLLLIIVNSFAITTYRDGSKCNCDSIVTIYDPNNAYIQDQYFYSNPYNRHIITQYPYTNGIINGSVKKFYDKDVIMQIKHSSNLLDLIELKLNDSINVVKREASANISYYSNTGNQNIAKVAYYIQLERDELIKKLVYSFDSMYTIALIDIVKKEYSNNTYNTKQWMWLNSVIYYVNGIPNGKETIYYEHGGTEYENNYVNGVLNGISKKFHKNGSLYEEYKYVDGKIEGNRKQYFENGKVAGTSTYKNGELIGYKKCSDGRFGNEQLQCDTTK